MTPRERLFAILAGEPVDQLPVWLLFPYHPVGYYADVRNHPQYRAVFERSQEDGVIFLNRRNPGYPSYTEEVKTESEPIRTSRGDGTRTRITVGNESIYTDSLKESGEVVRKFLETESDLEFFCNLPLELDEARIHATLDSHLPVYLREREEFPVDQGAMMLDLGSAVNSLYKWSNLEEYAIWSLTEKERIIAWLQKKQAQLRIVYRYFLERDLADVYFLVGSELASPPMLSRSTFQQWVVPFEGEIIAMIHHYGKKVIQHYHGQIREILPDFVTMGPDAIHTIEAPPVGNCTLDEAFRITKNQITLIGNIQYDDFLSPDPEKMKQSVHSVVSEAAGRRFILSPSAGPYDRNPPPALIKNYLAFLDAARRETRLQ